MSRYLRSISWNVSVPDRDGRRNGPAEWIDRDEDDVASIIAEACEQAMAKLGLPEYVWINGFSINADGEWKNGLST